ncbi:MAG: CcoQ/FixQ family Cbb3-type cytochrome c oxidase assembly chaperone [Bacteroidota bacterium]
MFSFIKKYAETIQGIEVYPKIAMFFFLVVFIGMVWFALRADKKYITELENLPLD